MENKASESANLIAAESTQTLSCREAIERLFDRPAEPFFTRDGVFFDCPEELLTDQHQKIKETVKRHVCDANTKTVQVKPLGSNLRPALSEVEKLRRYESFSVFNRSHLECANKLIRILIDMPDADSFLSVCLYARERVNIDLFVYAVSIAVLHRDDTKDVNLLSNVQVFPHLYIDGSNFAPLLEQLDIDKYTDTQVQIDSNGPTASDLDIEHRLAYWREDVGANLHHWHWHLVYPQGTSEADLRIVNKNRRGELFYYMHQQMIARYNFERFSLRLPRVRRFNDFREPIAEGYYPRLHDRVTGRDFASRQANSVWQDLRRETADEPIVADINHMQRWRDVILNAIHAQQAMGNDGKPVDLKGDNGIDILGNMIEASILSPNFNLYGDLHNTGHLMIAYIHDPDYRYLQHHGAMGANTTSMRDPAFYTWHAYIDDIFQIHKELLDPYSEETLNFPQITVEGLTVEVENGNDNTLATYFQQKKVDVNKGLNFLPRGPSFVTITHLEHAQFSYNIQVVNESGAERLGTVRIFMAPRNDERNEKFVFQYQRRFFIELDRFLVNLENGHNIIKRHSSESSVTIPYKQLFAEEVPNNGSNFCKCGWPDYLLIPRGNAEGLQADLFVMITDARNDILPDNKSLDTITRNKCCKPAPEYCGLRGKDYPDKRPMGFPFDRRPRNGVRTLKEFLTPNMFVQDVTIKFDNKILPPPVENTKSSFESLREFFSG